MPSTPTDASREATALREAQEEIGVGPDGVTIVGELDDVWIPVSNFELRPFVGALPVRPELTPHTDEVAEIVELPLRQLLARRRRQRGADRGAGLAAAGRGLPRRGQRIWGATARTLAMFAAVLQQP